MLTTQQDMDNTKYDFTYPAAPVMTAFLPARRPLPSALMIADRILSKSYVNEALGIAVVSGQS